MTRLPVVLPLAKAAPLHEGDPTPPDVTITVTADPVAEYLTPADVVREYTEQGAALAALLTSVLPRVTVDAMFAVIAGEHAARGPHRALLAAHRPPDVPEGGFRLHAVDGGVDITEHTTGSTTEQSGDPR